MWTYDETDLATNTSTGRLNAVRLLIGDTNTNDQQVQNEEIVFALSESGNNVYSAASWMAKVLAGKYARLVDVDLDGQVAESYSQLQQHYSNLSDSLEYQGKLAGASLGVAAGGASKTAMKTVEELPDRVKPRIRRDMFTIDGALGYYSGED